MTPPLFNPPAASALLQSSTAPGLAKAETMPRIVMSAQNVTIGAVTGTVFMTAIELPSGLAVTNVNWEWGTTAGVSPTHWWAGIADAAGVQRAASADQGAAAIAATTAVGLAMAGGPYITPAAGVYWFLLSVTATTNPTISGHAAVPGSSLVVPCLAGVSTSAAQPTPGVNGTTTYALPTGDNAVGYFYTS